MNLMRRVFRVERTVRTIVPIIVLSTLFAASPASAQVLGPGLDRHRLEVGYTFKWYERDFETEFLGQEDWSTGAFFLRYGVCRWATMSFEGGIWTVDNEDFEGIVYDRYTFGSGLSVRCWEKSSWRVEFSGHYSEIFDHDPSASQFDKNVRDITAVVQVERDFPVRGDEVIVWAGPAFAYNQSRQYPWRATDPVKHDSSDNFGFAVGLHAVLFDRLNLYSHGVYVDTFQPRLGAAVRF